jgi:O-antigen ligase
VSFAGHPHAVVERAAGERTAVFSLQSVATVLTGVTLAWGALAFGAVYSWGWWSMALFAVTAGAAGMLATRADIAGARAPTAETPSRGFLVALAAIVASVALQLVPLPLDALRILNGNAIALLERLDLAFAYNPGPHALSVWPAGTRIGLGLLVSLALLLVGTVRLLSIGGARRMIEMIIIIGVALAIIGIVQKPLYVGKIYGFWAPHQGGNPFGPFVNKNHFAGWMLMALPLAIGYSCAIVAKSVRGVRPEWHNRVLWLSSPEANKLLMTALGITVMGLALMLTLSRSGISALGVALAITGWFVLRRFQGRSRTLLAVGLLVLLPSLLLGWAGIDTIAGHFAAPDWGQLGGRAGAWADAAATFGRHWLTGTGLNTYQVANLFYQEHDKETFVSAAHNDYLQLAAEGGLLLVVPILLCIILFARDVRRRFREDGETSSYWLRAGAVTALFAIALQETVEFSLQIPGNAALFAVVCAIALHRSPQRLAR